MMEDDMAQPTLYLSMEELGDFVKKSTQKKGRAHSHDDEQGECKEASPKRKTNPGIPDSLIRSISEHPELVSYNLSQQDLFVIANIFHKANEDYSVRFELSEIMEFIPDLKKSIHDKLSYAQSLVDRKILSLCYTPDVDFHHDVSEFLQARFQLNGFLWNILLGKSPQPALTAKLTSMLADGAPFQDAVCDALDLLYDYYPELSDKLFKLRGIYYGHRINMLLDMAFDYLAQEGPEHSFQQLCSKHVPDLFWQKCLLMIYRYQRQNDTVEIPTLAALLSQDEAEYRQNLQALRQNNYLVRNKIVEDSSGRMFADALELSEEGLALLAVNAESPQADISLRVKESKFFDLITPEQNLSRLVLPAAVMQSIQAIIQRLQNPEPDILHAWGLHTASLSSEQSIHGACNILLHGEPGTGKTYIAGVIANELQRPLIQINASNIRNCYYGRTEKQAKELFREMQSLAKHHNPVFLLNEGDQLVHHRLQGSTSGADNAENSIQSIFLEALETFTGVLILTSNLIQNLDPALSRRFHYKLQIPIPELPERIKLWEIHLPKSIPGSEAIDIQSLAEHFCFTGGQISTVVLNACHHAASRPEARILLFADLWHYANLENGSSFESKKRLVGF